MAALITLLLYALAATRMLRLMKDDKLTESMRVWWTAHTPKGSLRRYWISCGWCLSIAGSLWPAAAYVLAPNHAAPRLAAAVLAFSWLAVIAQELHQIAYGKAVMYSPPPAVDVPAPPVTPQQQEATR